MNRTHIVFLSGMVALLALLGGCASTEELKAESDRLFLVPPGAAGPGPAGPGSADRHIVKVSDYHTGGRDDYVLGSVLRLSDSSDSLGLLFDLSGLPENRSVRRATLALYRLETAPADNLYFGFLRTRNPEYLFDHMVLGNVNAAYGYVESKATISDYGSTYVIEQAQVQDNEENILETLDRINYTLSDKEHIRLAESTRQIPVWHTGQPWNEGGLLGWVKQIRYRDLIYHFMEDKVNEARHEGNWDLFEVTGAVRNDYRGDKKLLLVLMQYPLVYANDAMAKVPLLGSASTASFNVVWASLRNSPEAAPQLIVEFDSPQTAAAAAGPQETQPGDTRASLKRRLAELKGLLDDGIITPDEYERKRQSLIDETVDRATRAEVREKLERQRGEPAPPPVADARLEAGAKSFAAGRYDTAATEFAAAMGRAPEDPVLPFSYAQALFAAGRYGEAAGALRTALRRVSPEKEGIVYPRGLYANEEVLFAQVEDLLDQVDRAEDDADLQLLLGYHLLGIGETGYAREPLERAGRDAENAEAAGVLLRLLERLPSQGEAAHEAATRQQ